MAQENTLPLVIVLSAPSGAGKTTLVNALLERMDNIERSVSSTTRPPRDDEERGKDYIFISEEEFKKSIDNDDFLEWEQNFGHFYGTSLKQVHAKREQGKDVILSIDIKGAQRVARKIPDSISIFVMPPSAEELKERLIKRKTETEDQLKMRISESEKEMAAADKYDYLVINDDIEKAVEELAAIIQQERKRRQKQAGEKQDDQDKENNERNKAGRSYR